MGVCHECKCFYCENLGTKECPVKTICSTCFKGVNSRQYVITHCDKQKVYRPFVPVFENPRPKRPFKAKKSKHRRDK